MEPERGNVAETPDETVAGGQPFRALAALIPRAGKETIKNVGFDTGSADVHPPEKKKLSRLADGRGQAVIAQLSGPQAHFDWRWAPRPSLRENPRPSALLSRASRNRYSHLQIKTK